MISQILILVVLIGINAFFAASEIAFISLNDNKIETYGFRTISAIFWGKIPFFQREEQTSSFELF